MKSLMYPHKKCLSHLLFFDSQSRNTATSFLFIKDTLNNSTSANAETIFSVPTTQLNKVGLELRIAALWFLTV